MTLDRWPPEKSQVHVLEDPRIFDGFWCDTTEIPRYTKVASLARLGLRRRY